jgi:hypothetical protein
MPLAWPVSLCATRRLIIAFTTARHWTLFWVSLIQSTSSHPISSTFHLMLPTHLRLGHESVLSDGYFVHLSSVSKRPTCVTHLILTDLIILITSLFGEVPYRAFFSVLPSLPPSQRRCPAQGDTSSFVVCNSEVQTNVSVRLAPCSCFALSEATQSCSSVLLSTKL